MMSKKLNYEEMSIINGDKRTCKHKQVRGEITPLKNHTLLKNI